MFHVPSKGRAIAFAAKSTTSSATIIAANISGWFGGYALERKIGPGAEGAVFVGRSAAFSGAVAVKVISPGWTGNPVIAADRLREAFAADQLCHTNIVRSLDVATVSNAVLYTMEYVPGKTLASFRRTEGVVQPEMAVTFALQAARGLKEAHDHGVFHRDIKPENIILGDDGVVKMADMGHAPPGGSLSSARCLAPELVGDATRGNARSDIYALGCTLFDLVTGRPMYEGATAAEVIARQTSERPPAADEVVKHVPKAISSIIQKMTQKIARRPESMGAVVHGLEHFLGLKEAAAFHPRKEQIAQLEDYAAKFDDSKFARRRRNIIRIFYSVLSLGIVAAVVFGLLAFAGGLIGLGVMSTVFYQCIVGVMQKTHLYVRLRLAFRNAGVITWLKVIITLGLLIFVFWLFNQLLIWLGVAMVAAVLAAAFHIVIDGQVGRQRRPQVMAAMEMFRTMCATGLAEESIRRFVCQHCGYYWEEFYEAIFGYDAKMHARRNWGRDARGHRRGRYAGWRDGLIAWADDHVRTRIEARQRILLEQAETRKLAAEGLDQVVAAKGAKKRVEALFLKAAELRDQRLYPDMENKPTQILSETSDERLAELRTERRLAAASHLMGGRITWVMMGPHVRLVLGGILLACFVGWLNQNNIARPDDVAKAMNQQYRGLWLTKENASTEPAENQKPEVVQKVFELKPLELPLVPPEIGGVAFSNFAPVVAGICLLISSLWRGSKISFFIIPAAALLVGGPLFGIPAVGPLSAIVVSTLAGLLFVILGFWLGREKE